MYGWLDYTIMGILVALNLFGGIVALATVDKPREYVTARSGIRSLFLQIVITFWLLWFGYQGRTSSAEELMTITTFSLVGLRTIAFFQTINRIENRRYTGVRTSRQAVMTTISVLVQIAAVSLMFGLALAYG